MEKERFHQFDKALQSLPARAKRAWKLSQIDGWAYDQIAGHLGAAPEGQAFSWRTFPSALGAPEFSPAEEDRVAAGAESAFARVRTLVEDSFPRDGASITGQIGQK